MKVVILAGGLGTRLSEETTIYNVENEIMRFITKINLKDN